MALGLWQLLCCFLRLSSCWWVLFVAGRFCPSVFFWGLWVLLTPAAVLLSFRFPFERSRLFQSLGIHLLACVLVVTASQFAFSQLHPQPLSAAWRGTRNREPGCKLLPRHASAERISKSTGCFGHPGLLVVCGVCQASPILGGRSRGTACGQIGSAFDTQQTPGLAHADQSPFPVQYPERDFHADLRQSKAADEMLGT